jgi:hypothetical protein
MRDTNLTHEQAMTLQLDHELSREERAIRGDVHPVERTGREKLHCAINIAKV